MVLDPDAPSDGAASEPDLELNIRELGLRYIAGRGLGTAAYTRVGRVGSRGWRDQ